MSKVQNDLNTFPMQPIVMTPSKVVRFKENRMVSALLDFGDIHGMGMNKLARMEFTAEERMQFAQLVGYSVGGYGTLSYASAESVAKADAVASELIHTSSTIKGETK